MAGATPTCLAEWKELLTSLSIVSDMEWERALNDARRMRGEPDEIRSVLDRLEAMRPEWSRDHAVVVTPFQTEEILAGNAPRLRIGGYVLLDKLGTGDMGQVYKARNLKLDAIRALKVTTFPAEDREARSTALARFRREAKTLGRLDHPALPKISDYDETDDFAYIAMDFVEGENLESVVERSGGNGLPVQRVVKVLIAVAEALRHLHESGVIHRNIKPANVLLSNKGHTKLVNLGLAKRVSMAKLALSTTPSGRTTPGQLIGTPAFTAPEQWFDSSSGSPASDTYSLGCTAFYALTGKLPFPDADADSLKRSITSSLRPRPSKFRNDLPPALDEIVSRMMAVDPNDRFRSAADVAAALEAIVAPAGPVTYSLFSHRFRILAASGAVGILLLGTLALWLLNR